MSKKIGSPKNPFERSPTTMTKAQKRTLEKLSDEPAVELDLSDLILAARDDITKELGTGDIEEVKIPKIPRASKPPAIPSQTEESAGSLEELLSEIKDETAERLGSTFNLNDWE